jgi:hypothetical protein
MGDFKYEVKEVFGVLSESSKGWTKEFRSISWNGRDPKYDIREWAPDDETMAKGITLTKDEAKKLKELLNQIDL